MAALTFFDAEHVERQTPERPWRMLVLASAAMIALLTAGWEAYWRAGGYLAGDFKNTPSLWAQEYRKATGKRTVLLGASRTLFNDDLDIWEATTGDRPIQLALEGTSPRTPLHMLAEREDFAGLVIVDVTPPIFFPDFQLREEVFRYVGRETPAQRTEHAISLLLEKAFAFIDDQTRPKKMIYNALLPVRPGMVQRYDVLKLAILGADRNAEMWARVVEDEAYQKHAQYVWKYSMDYFPPDPMTDEEISTVIASVKADIDRLRARGGDVIFVQHPYTKEYEPEEGLFPRGRFWDPLLATTAAKGITFLDQPELQGYWLPEWSHIEAKDAERYTRALAILISRAMEASAREKSR